MFLHLSINICLHICQHIQSIYRQTYKKKFTNNLFAYNSNKFMTGKLLTRQINDDIIFLNQSGIIKMNIFLENSEK